jgi:putative transposase
LPGSRTEIYLHLVWTTHCRLPLITADVEQAIYACMLKQANALRCEVLAIGGMPDHVHVAVRLAPMASSGQLVRQMKGVSSTLVRTALKPGETFAWQNGYGAFSISRSHLPRVLAYVRDQKRHHAESTLWADWESDERDADARSAPRGPAHGIADPPRTRG